MNAKVVQAEEILNGSDNFIRELADTVLELRANTEQLEDILKRMKEEGDDG